jgi:DNA modification methylase
MGKKVRNDRLSTLKLTSEGKERLQARIRETGVEHVATTSLVTNPKNAKRHSERQVVLLGENIRKFGMTNPLLVDENSMLLAGHGRLEAIRMLGLPEVPVIRLTHLTDHEKTALALADNRLSELGEWDADMLPAALKELTDASIDHDFDVEIITGFDTVEIDRLLGGELAPKQIDRSEEFPPLDTGHPPITAIGDSWQLGKHILLCADARAPRAFKTLMGEDRARFVFTDPPYNVSIAGHVSKRADSREFAMASGEMSSEEYREFLRTAFSNVADHVAPGAVIDVCIDWAHLEDLSAAVRHTLGPCKTLAVWVKPNAGLGTFYRSRHELIPIFVMPGGAPINNFALGARGRYRTNVWEYPGLNSFSAERQELLAMHPTVKPVAMVADAIRDCSKRNDFVLDPFAGSGTTVIACEKTGRRARVIEIDAHYCDVIIQRFEKFTGEQATLVGTQEHFSDVASRRVAMTRAGEPA